MHLGRPCTIDGQSQRADWFTTRIAAGNICPFDTPSVWPKLASNTAGSVGDSYDNAAVKTFFKTNKAEMIWRRTWETRRQAETAIFQCIHGFYNPRRRHSALGGKSPLAFERQVA